MKILKQSGGIPTEVDVSGWDDLISDTGTAAAGSAAPTLTSFGVHRLEVWAINDSKTFKFHVKHGYKAGTSMYPHVHWRAMSANPNTAQTVQFDLTYQIGRSYSQAPFTSDVTISLLDNPTGYNFNEIIEASDVQALIATNGIEVDALIEITVKRVTPVSGTSYTGNVVVDYVDIHFQDDGSLTTTKNAPFTKVVS